MAGRQPPPRASSNNGSSTSNSRRVKGQEEDGGGVGGGVRKEKGLNGAIARQTDDGSDGDELGDSESERGEVDQGMKRKSATTTTSTATTGTKGATTGRGRGRPSNSSAKTAASATSTAKTGRASSLVETRRSPYVDIPLTTDKHSFSTKKPASPLTAIEKSSALDGTKVSRPAPPAPESPRETSKTTTASSSTSAPYYYSQSSAAQSKGPSNSPRDAQSKNRMPPFTTMKVDGAPPPANSEDLTMHEVDKFLDLIEKHNLHTSNEDEMARSVTELYQEWLEWCAKRSIQSTKSKQALVAEFVRIHQGEYGRLRQQRAMEIVKGRAGGMQDNPLTADLSSQTMAFMPPSKSAPSFSAPSRYEDDSRDGHKSKSLSASTSSKRIPSGSTSSHYIHVPSPSVAPRALTPGPTTAFHDNHGQSSESLYRRVRDEVWTDASVMIERVVHEQMMILIEKNSALRGRVEQLEIHSDNLAQWIQHLNRVQEELTQSVQSAGPPLREAVVVAEEPVNKYSRQPAEQQRTYAPTYHIGVTSTQSSPKRNYAVRRSPSPPIISRHSSSVVARRSLHSPHRDQPRDTRDYHSSGSQGHSTRVALSDPYDRSYYNYPPDDRKQAPPLPSHSPHQAKRPRNGY